MQPSPPAGKHSRRYRYYVTRPDQLDGTPAWRVSAHDLERLVCTRLSELLADQQALCRLACDAPADAIRRLLQQADLAAAALRSGPARERAQLLAKLVTRIDLGEASIAMVVEPDRLATALLFEHPVSSQPIQLTLAATKVRRGHQLRLVITAPAPTRPVSADRDEKLVALISETYAARQLILAHPEQSIANLASRHNRCRTRLGKLAALACLAPDIVTAILEGRQPATLTARTLQEIELPLAWAEQRALLGFG
jgi:hypothetical protein